MPRVPISQGEQIRVQPLNPARQGNIDVSSGLQAVGRGLGNLAEGFDQIALREDEAKANEVDVSLTRDFNKWEDENIKKYTNKDAKGYRDAVDAWWKEAAGAYGKDLSPRAQNLVGRTLARRQSVALDQAGKYERVEQEKYFDSTALAAMDSSQRTALRTGDYAGEAQRTRDLAAQMAQRKNFDRDQSADFIAKRMGTYHTAVVSQLAEKDANAARAYLETAIQQGEIGDNQPRLETIIKREADNQTALRNAQEWVTLPEKEREAKLAAITDPEIRKATITHLDQAEAHNLRRKNARAAEVMGRAELAYEKTGNVPAALMLELEQTDAGKAADLRKYIRADRKARLIEARNGGVVTDQGSYFEARDRVIAGEPFNVLEYRDKVGRGDLEELKKMQETRGKAGPKQDSLLSDEARINNALTSLGIDKKKHPQEAANIVRAIETRVQQMSAAKGGKDLLPSEKDTAVDEIVMNKVYVDEWGSDPEKPVAMLKDAEVKGAYVKVGGKDIPLSAVPRDDRMQIIDALRKTGKPVTEQAIVTLYMMGQAKKKAAPVAIPAH